MSIVRKLLLDMTRRSAWANHNVIDACSALSEEELAYDFRISHKNLLGTLSHIYHGERVWLNCLMTTADGGTWRLPPGPDPALSLNGLRSEWPQVSQGFSGWLEGKSEAELEHKLNLLLPGGVEAGLPRWKILCHVLDHSTLHRGQVIGMFRMLGHLPPAVSPMDYYLSHMTTQQPE